MSNTGLYESDSDEPEAIRSRYGGDSDEESLVDVDSPADGYFERREHPQTTYIPNPATQESRSEEDKAREAAAERRAQHERQQQQQQQGDASRGQRAGERERPPSHASQPRSPVWAQDERTPLLDAGPAGPPPDYAAATADRRNGHGREGSYGSLSDSAFSSDHPLVRNGLLNEQGVFGQRSEPQSMRDGQTSSASGSLQRVGLRGGGGESERGTGAEGDEERGFIRRHWDRDWNGRRRWTRHFKAKRLFTWLAVFGILALILLLSGVFEDVADNGKYPSGGNGRNNPGSSPSYPSDGAGKDKDPSRDKLMPPHQSTAQCPYSYFSTPEKSIFPSPANFSLLEFIENPTERAFFNDRITGTIQFSPAPSEQEDAIVVWMSVAISGPAQLGRMRRVRDEEGMEILFPDVSGDIKIVDSAGEADGWGRWDGDDHSCLDFSVAVLVKPGTRLDELIVGTANFDVHVEHGVFDEQIDQDEDRDDDEDVDEYTSVGPAFEHVDAMTITAVRGHVRAAYLSSRTTYIETTSSSIKGTYALRDLLSVKSTSGSIHIDVDPKNASAEDPEHSADFRAKSNSGSIDVGYLTDKDIPERDYTTRVETSSSSVKGNYILGSTARFESNSGSLDLSVLPYFADKESTLHTSSGSAHTALRVLPPYTTSASSSPYDPFADTLKHMKSTHKSNSGSLHLTYPDAWSGVIDGSSNSGSIKVRGEDVEILLDQDLGKDLPGYGRGGKALKHVTARKGYGESRMGFETASGSVDVLVGRE